LAVSVARRRQAQGVAVSRVARKLRLWPDTLIRWMRTGSHSAVRAVAVPKGEGFKAMFKLVVSMPQAQELAAQYPERFEVGKTGWVTARFTVAKPLPERVRRKWLAESYEVACGTERAPRTARTPKRQR